MKRSASSVAALIAGALLALGAPGEPAFAKSDKRPCVTRQEYSQVKKGQTLQQVHKLFDTKGKLLFQNPGVVTNGAREYRTCRGSGLGAKVQVQYNNYATRGGPFRVVYLQSY